MSNATTAIRLPDFFFPTHIPPRVPLETVETVLLKLVGSALLNMSKALEVHGQEASP